MMMMTNLLYSQTLVVLDVKLRPNVLIPAQPVRRSWFITMPTRSTYNHSSTPNYPPTNSSQISTMITTSNAHVDLTSYIGKMLTINQHQVIVEDILGQGGFAFVFLVRASNQQRFALKRMYVNNEHDLLVCQREISILKEFSSHGNIVKYIDSSIQRLSPTTNLGQKRHGNAEKDLDEQDDQEEDAIYEILLLTEYCSHGALITRLIEQRANGIQLSERQILRIFADICYAVGACHYRRPQPILHRDIKLENILIDSHQSFVLCDFGSAIFLPPSPTNEHQQYQINQLTTAVIQQLEEEIQRYTTLAYRAPEMIDLYSRRPITLKADIWAMGCLLYKLMYNSLPFGDSILAIQNGTFTLPDEMAQVYSRELNLFLRYILEIDLTKRPDIWQVSYVTFKLLGTECLLPNRFHSKIPDLSNISMPLTESESRHQRAMALAASKSLSANQSDETVIMGTAVNPRERPRGMIAPSGSFINFNQTNQRSIPLVVPPPIPPPTVPNQSRSTHQRSGSAAQSMFEDDFSQFPSHALSLTNLPNPTLSTPKSAMNNVATPERNVSRARPSPPSSISTASGQAIQQQLFPPPPPPSTTLTQSTSAPHRRSASQTISPTNNPSSVSQLPSLDSSSTLDQRRHSIDSSGKTTSQQVFIGEASDDDDDDADAEALASNLNKLKVHNHSTENVKSRESLILNEDDRLFAKTYMINSQLKSDDEQTSSASSADEHEKSIQTKSKKKSQLPLTPLRGAHHPTVDEGEKNLSSPSTNNKNLVQRLIERCSLQQTTDESTTNSSTTAKRKDSFTLSSDNPIIMSDQRQANESDSDDDDDDDREENLANDNDKVGFDQLINEDSDDDQQTQSTINPTKTAMSTGGLFLSTRLKEQQYEHFEDSDDDDEVNSKSSMNKTSSNPTTKLFQLFTSNTKTNSLQDTKRVVNESNNNNSTRLDYDNPFLHAPFHHAHRSPTQKSQTTSTFLSSSSSIPVDTSTSSFDPTSIVVGKRLSAFAPYHRQEPNVVDSTASSYNFNSNKQKLPHSESYPPGTSSNPNPNSSTVSKDVFTNAPFKGKLSSKQARSMASNKVNTAISPSSSQSTSSSNSQLIDLSIPSQILIESSTTIPTTTATTTIAKDSTPRSGGSASLAMHFSTLANTSNENNNTYYFHPDGHSSSEELTTSTRKRSSKKKSLLNTANQDSQEQHAYANLSFNDAIVDEFL